MEATILWAGLKHFWFPKVGRSFCFSSINFDRRLRKKIVDICAARFSQHRFSMCAESAYIGDDEEKRENQEKEEEEEQ